MTGRPIRTAAFAAALVASSASLARAEHASVTLSYPGAKAATTCPDEATFRGLVAARLGYDPFTGAGSRTLAVALERRGNEVVGRLTLSDGNDGKRAERTLRANADECFELGTSLALVAAVAVDPDASAGRTAAPAPAPNAPPVTEPVPTPPPPPVQARTVAPPTPSKRSVRLELGALLSTGVVPALSGGIRAGGGLDFGAGSIGAEGTFLFPSSRENPTGEGEVSAFVVAGSLVPCVAPLDAESLGLELCAVGSLGVLRGSAQGVTRAEPASDLFATVGPRVALVVMLSRTIGVGASADVPIALSRVHLHIEENGQRQQVWAAPPVGFIGAVSLVARLK